MKNKDKNFFVNSFGSYPINNLSSFKILCGILLGIVIILNNFPDCLLACDVYLPSTNK